MAPPDFTSNAPPSRTREWRAPSWPQPSGVARALYDEVAPAEVRIALGLHCGRLRDDRRPPVPPQVVLRVRVPGRVLPRRVPREDPPACPRHEEYPQEQRRLRRPEGPGAALDADRGPETPRPP